MIVARCNFGSCPSSLQRDRLEDLAHGYLSSLLKNGQILYHYDLAWTSGVLWSYAPLSRRDAFAESFLSDAGRITLARLKVDTGLDPSWEILDDESEEEMTDWQDSKSFVMLTHLLDTQSPVVSLPSILPVALYTLPISDTDREAVHSWTCHYREFDSTYMASEILEREAYKQLADVSSSLSVKGRELGARIEKASGITTYYYMHRYWGTTTELTKGRPCPGCGGDWMINQGNIKERYLWLFGSEDSSPRSFYNFDYLCRDCRLVSHHPVNFDDRSMARVGRWKPQTYLANN